VLALIARLYFLQSMLGAEYASKSEDNFVQFRSLPALRGAIFDRNGEVLVDNRPSFNLYVTPAFAKDKEAVIKRLDTTLELSSDELALARRRVLEAKGLNRFRPQLIRSDLPQEKLAQISYFRSQLEGVDILPLPRRRYRYGVLAAHAIGYMNEISAKELETLTKQGQLYKRGDMIGRQGLERSMEVELAGKDGETKVVVDATGRPLDERVARQIIPDPVIRPAQNGSSIRTTLDLNLQRRAEEIFAPYRAGALVAMETKTGFIRAMVSHPSYDPNRLMAGLSRGQYEELIHDPARPLLSRAVGSAYPPGSTYKIVGALTALGEKLVTPQGTYPCPGYHTVGGHSFRCHRESGHGLVNLAHALQWSCDVYFYRLAERLGIDKLAEYAHIMGLGSKLGVDQPFERVGIVPTRERHERHTPGGYRLGFALNAIIGQGDVTLTPLQLASLYATVANRGRVLRPQLVERVISPEGKIVRQSVPEVIHEVLGIPDAGWDEIEHGLDYVVNEPGGTAYKVRIPEVRVVGKTGTAQVARLGKLRKKTEEMPWHLRDHAWFVAYAPKDNPEIVVAVIHEHGGHGGTDAAPIAMEFLRAYFGLDELN
jgi:penicillin-binding protein 2